LLWSRHLEGVVGGVEESAGIYHALVTKVGVLLRKKSIVPPSSSNEHLTSSISLMAILFTCPICVIEYCVGCWINNIKKSSLECV
jgi:hypothetical protein